MSLYIQDEKKHTVRHYCTSPQIEKAIETLLRYDEVICGSETHMGYRVTIIKESGFRGEGGADMGNKKGD